MPWFDGELQATVEDDAGTGLTTSIGGTAFDNLVVSSVADAADINKWSLF